MWLVFTVKHGRRRSRFLAKVERGAEAFRGRVFLPLGGGILIRAQAEIQDSPERFFFPLPLDAVSASSGVSMRKPGSCHNMSVANELSAICPQCAAFFFPLRFTFISSET